MNICILGKDGTGWSIDSDRHFLIQALNAGNYNTSSNILNADIVWLVWYSVVLKTKFRLLHPILKRKKVIASLTNDPSHHSDRFHKIKGLVDYWVCANSKQIHFLEENGIASECIFRNPFYVDETVFYKKMETRKELAHKLGIALSDIQDKILIGSFQRDSAGANLNEAKWHKNPDMLIESLVLLNQHKQKYVLVLAGPRRHYVINQCKAKGIPYVFVGDESCITKHQDDLETNNLASGTINDLYNIVDFYFVTSVSEGGPKAIIESALTHTCILSTNVGMAKDLLDSYSICNTSNAFVEKTRMLLDDPDEKEELIANNYKRVFAMNNSQAFNARIKNIIEITTKS